MFEKIEDKDLGALSQREKNDLQEENQEIKTNQKKNWSQVFLMKKWIQIKSRIRLKSKLIHLKKQFKMFLTTNLLKICQLRRLKKKVKKILNLLSNYRVW